MKLKVINKSPHELKFAHEGDSGKDVSAWFGDNPKDLQIETAKGSDCVFGRKLKQELYYGKWQITLDPNERAKIPTGIFIEIPEGFEIQVRPKSGKSFKKGLNVILGTVDLPYIGEIMVIVHNISSDAITITESEAIAQIVLVPVVHNWEIEQVESLNETTRGEGGFGSTEKK